VENSKKLEKLVDLRVEKKIPKNSNYTGRKKTEFVKGEKKNTGLWDIYLTPIHTQVKWTSLFHP
jgi:hypothetical protein